MDWVEAVDCVESLLADDADDADDCVEGVLAVDPDVEGV